MSIQLNDRHITQLEELESLKGKLQCPSYRSRNLSSDRQYTPSLTNDFRSTRNSEQQKDSQSVEKFLNLKKQNQNVDNLSQLWKQQKQSIQLPQSIQSQNSINKQEIDQQIPKYTHLVIEEEENLVTEQDANKIKVVQAANNVRVNGKFPNATKQAGQKKIQQSAQQIQTSNNQIQTKKTNSNNNTYNTNNNNSRPQTTKSQVQVPQTPLTQKKTVQKSNTKSFQDPFQDVPQTPSQKLQQSSLLEKSRQGKTNQAINKVITKKNPEEDQRNLILQLAKIKESVTKLYDSRFEKQLTHSSQFIEKNFDQIINTLKLDFRFHENDI
ncbi:unnamed protein product [Paramecium octaurelia]|uniref:Uncharacterized protein n=1 Tax=Paramecium octaurelia TaxID=43137 RepID=A0A8S1S5D2_PAROT|nr:unnamed protein product [Paramecium octaurelia]